jgi:hypothetical protein
MIAVKSFEKVDDFFKTFASFDTRGFLPIRKTAKRKLQYINVRFQRKKSAARKHVSQKYPPDIAGNFGKAGSVNSGSSGNGGRCSSPS